MLASGAVSDTGFRPLPGARVEVVDGPDAGMSAIADAAGRFTLTGRFDDSTLFRATREGHIKVTKTLAPCCPTSRALYFFLGVPAPSATFAGDYALTVAADSACTDLPNEMRTRTYQVTVEPVVTPSIAADSWFSVSLPVPPFIRNYDSFLIGVAGSYLALNLEESEGPYLVEEVAPNSYLAIGGVATTTVGPGVSTISLPLAGTIEYCELRSPMGSYYNCAAPVSRARCVSNAHRVTLTKR